MKWINTLLAASRDFKRDPCPGPKLAQNLRDAGFQDVQEIRYKLPIGPWPKDKFLVRFTPSITNDPSTVVSRLIRG